MNHYREHRAKFLQEQRRDYHPEESECPECEGTGRVERVTGYTSKWIRCSVRACWKGTIYLDFDNETSDKWLETWHGSNEEKD